LRICSLLPSATEILFALGLGDSIVGVTHECDFPPAAKSKPPLIRPRVDPHAPPAEIDRQVRELVERGESIYGVDADLLESLAPDLIVTQDLCHVCAASPEDLASALSKMSRQPKILALTPHSLADVWSDIEKVGEATGTSKRAKDLTADLQARVAAVQSRVKHTTGEPVRVLCLEWLEPYYVAGHWVPEMVELAGGQDVFGRARESSFTVASDEIATSRADVLIVMPCGYDVVRADVEFRASGLLDVWKDLPAVANGRVFALDANSYTSRPGPRLADGVELLHHLFYPQNQQSARQFTSADFVRI
jgi:iron complex transport system substrate-binding protein